MRKIYVNGCSFSFHPDAGFPMYSEIIGDHYKIDYINRAWPGSCNRRIIRTTLRDSLDLPPGSLAIIQLTFLGRTEKVYSGHPDSAWKMLPDSAQEEYHESIKLVDSSDPDENAYMSFWLRYFDEPAELTDLASQIIMLTGHLKSRGIDYFIYPHLALADQSAVNCVSDDRLMKEISQDPKIFNFLGPGLADIMDNEDFYHDGPKRHFNAAGHQKAADWLLDKINQLYGPE